MKGLVDDDPMSQTAGQADGRGFHLRCFVLRKELLKKSLRFFIFNDFEKRNNRTNF
jgi:hypothetical protein